VYAPGERLEIEVEEAVGFRKQSKSEYPEMK
jgi:hypothetical protein